MMRIAVIAALPGELRPLVRGWDRERRGGVDLWRARQGGREWIAACAGIGGPAAARAFAGTEAVGPIDVVVSAGWAGALREGFAPGAAFWVTGVVDGLTGERFGCAPGTPGLECLLVTQTQVASRAEKIRLAATHGAALVDMEASAIARLARLREIPFYCVKGVSDGPGEDLPDFNRFVSKNGAFATGRFALFALLRPAGWPVLIRLAGNSKQAARKLRDRLADIPVGPA